jgi:large subunit ribosomal protein L18
MNAEKKRKLRLKRHRRLRYKVTGNGERPRLAVYKSLKHFYAQIIDDESGSTLIQASSLDKELKAKKDGSHPTIETCRDVADLLCDRARDKGIESVVFDHGGFGYKGRIKAFAERAREKGLAF